MIKYVQHNRNFILKSYRNHLSVVCPSLVEYYIIPKDLGIEFFLDDGTYLHVLPASINIKPMILYGNVNLTIQEIIGLDSDVNSFSPRSIKPGQEMCYLYPVSRAYFGKIEIEQITEAQKDFINAKG